MNYETRIFTAHNLPNDFATDLDLMGLEVMNYSMYWENWGESFIRISREIKKYNYDDKG